MSYCRSQEPQAEYPVEWLPRLHTNAVKEFIETNAIVDLRDVPDEYLDDLQQRVKTQTLLGTPFFDHKAAAADLPDHARLKGRKLPSMSAILDGKGANSNGDARCSGTHTIGLEL